MVLVQVQAVEASGESVLKILNRVAEFQGFKLVFLRLAVRITMSPGVTEDGEVI